MKIGLYGGMANNLYILAKALVAAGADVSYIRDRGQTHPFSQPVWEDVEATITFREQRHAARWSPAEWLAFERAHGWSPPPWLHDPLPPGHPRLRLRGIEVPLRVILGGGRRPHAAAALTALRRCDVLIVCGVEAELLALVSGVPYVVFPHGGDMALAAGLGQPASSRRGRARRALQIHLLRRAFRRALYVGCQDPTGCGGHKGDAYRGLPFIDQRQCPLPYRIRPRRPRAARLMQLNRLLSRTGTELSEARDFTVLVPSRIDFGWKGQDRLLRALASLSERERERFSLLLTGWGADHLRLQELSEELGLTHLLTFLPVTYSRPLLYQLFESVDLVADQFLFGAYGTSSLEAMSCGTPILTWIDVDAFESKGFPIPPALLGREPDQLAAHLQAIASGAVDLEVKGKEVAAFVEQVHEETLVARDLLAQLRRTLGWSAP